MWILTKMFLFPGGQHLISPNNAEKLMSKKQTISGQPFQHSRTGSQPIHKMAALKHGSRKFYDIPSEEFSNVRSRYNREKEKNIQELLNYIDQSCIGKDVMFSGPYGPRKGELRVHLQRECN